MKRGIALAAGLAAVGAATLAAALTERAAPEPAAASSHREAPLISEDPGADNVDLYAFRTAGDRVAIVANYIPLEEPAGGPNFAQFDDDVLYEIHVDNDGDALEDVTLQWRFRTGLRNANTFLYNTGPITSLDDADWNRPQTYTVTVLRRDASGGTKSTVLAADVPTPPVNVGPRSTPDYEALAAAAVTTLPNGVELFAGQRDDPFFVDLGSIFDLGGLRPFNSFHVLALANAAGKDEVASYNTHSIVVELPISMIGAPPNSTLGIYASASRRSVQILKKDGSAKSEGEWMQVSRLGNPLVNEVVIPLGEKDLWNRSDPADDEQFLGRYTTPELAGLVNFLYPALPDTPTTNRADLVAVLLTGIPGVNSTGPRKADLLRLNVGIAPDAPVGRGNRLGALGGELSGFPNGRRLEDDVTDIELRAVACGYGDFLAGAIGLCNLSPNNLIGDGVDANDRPFSTSFPFLATPHQGYEH